MHHTMVYRRPLDSSVSGNITDEAFSHVSEFDDYKVVLGAKPVVQTRYEPMERKY